MPHPKVPNPRSKHVGVRLSEKEFRRVSRDAKKERLTVSRYVRKLLLGKVD